MTEWRLNTSSEAGPEDIQLPNVIVLELENLFSNFFLVALATSDIFQTFDFSQQCELLPFDLA